MNNTTFYQYVKALSATGVRKISLAGTFLFFIGGVATIFNQSILSTIKPSLVQYEPFGYFVLFTLTILFSNHSLYLEREKEISKMKTKLSLEPDVSVDLVPGSEYNFQINTSLFNEKIRNIKENIQDLKNLMPNHPNPSKISEKINKYDDEIIKTKHQFLFANSTCQIHVNISNNGNADVILSSISISPDLYHSLYIPFKFSSLSTVYINNDIIKLPYTLSAHDSDTVDIEIDVEHKTKSEIEFIHSMRETHDLKKIDTAIEIKYFYNDKPYTISTKATINPNPLRDIYRKHWKSNKKPEYINKPLHTLQT